MHVEAAWLPRQYLLLLKRQTSTRPSLGYSPNVITRDFQILILNLRLKHALFDWLFHTNLDTSRFPQRFECKQHFLYLLLCENLIVFRRNSIVQVVGIVVNPKRYILVEIPDLVNYYERNYLCIDSF